MEGKEEEQDKKELNIEEDTSIRNSRSRGKGRRFLSHYDLQAC